jgi:hypothetical protein
MEPSRPFVGRERELAELTDGLFMFPTLLISAYSRLKARSQQRRALT